MALMGPRPIDTVGNCQNSGIRRGWGYEGMPFGAADFSWRKRRAVLGETTLEEGAGVAPGEAWPWMKIWSPPDGSSRPRKKWLKPTS
ncbi:hypothetical protein HR12_40555 [Microbacterium sp. SUBG005]|nr:hypothetical protein HR12_40555 [Microbacterium sp. SUBG005]